MKFKRDPRQSQIGFLVRRLFINTHAKFFRDEMGLKIPDLPRLAVMGMEALLKKMVNGPEVNITGCDWTPGPINYPETYEAWMEREGLCYSA